MPRAIMFSQTFPSYHPKVGQPTFFVEKIWKQLLSSDDPSLTATIIGFEDRVILRNDIEIDMKGIQPKSHTIRAGHRWKENDLFSPRIWSGPPYRSKQIPIAKDLFIVNVWDILILPSHEIFIKGQPFGYFGSDEIDKLAYHNGLTPEDFKGWFSKLPFEGQVICWDPKIQY